MREIDRDNENVEAKKEAACGRDENIPIEIKEKREREMRERKTDRQREADRRKR